MRQLAYLSGISNSEISRIESGERIFPNLKTLKAICRYLDIYYEDCLYILNLGGTYNMNNPFIIEYYKNIDKDNIKTSYENITKKIELNNNQIVYMKQMILKGIKKEDEDILIDTIKSLEYENNTNNYIKNILTEKIIKFYLSEQLGGIRLNKDFFDEFSDIRDRMLKNIQLDKNSWNKFLIYWSKILDKYSVDNVLNLYTYNPTVKYL